MKSKLASINRFFENIPDILRQHRLKIVLVYLFIIVLLGYGLTGLKFDMSMESWFKTDDPVVIAFNKFRENFGSDDAVYIVYKAKDGDIFSEKSLRAVTEIQEALLNATLDLTEGESSILNHIISVKTIVNASFMDVEGDTLISREFIGKNIPVNQEIREQIRKQALKHKAYPLLYVSQNSQYGGIFIRTDFGTIPEDGASDNSFEDESADFFEEPDDSIPAESQTMDNSTTKFKKTSLMEYTEFSQQLDEIISKTKYVEDLEIYSVGNPNLMDVFNDILNIELSYIFLATIFLIFLILYILFRSLSAVVWPIFLVILTLIITLGILGWASTTMSLMFSMIVLMVLVIGVADSVHILSGYLFFRRKNIDHEAALRATYKKSGLACLLTSITTSIGLLSMLFTPIPPIGVFGTSAALGVMIAFLFTVFLLPLLLDIWHPISKKQETNLDKKSTPIVQKLLSKIEPFAYGQPKTILFIFTCIAAVSIYGLSQVKVNTNMVEVIKEGHPYRTAISLVDKTMGGTQSMEIHLRFDQQDALKDPLVLNRMDEFQEYLKNRQSHFVVRANSLVDVVKNSFQVLNENREDQYIIPQERAMLEQTLFLFDSANVDDRRLLVSDDYQQGHISVRLYNYGSIKYLNFFTEVENQIKVTFDPLREKYPGMKVTLTGGLSMMMKLVDYMSWAQIQSFGISLVIISIVLLFVFGSLKIGFIAMLPNIFPVLVTFGTMGILGISLDGDTLIIAPLVIGIAVDDTIHFMSHFRAHFAECGKVIESIVGSLQEAGQAIVFSTVILVCGFMTMVFSTHVGMSNFAYLSAIAFVSALAADLFLLPSLCVLILKNAPKKVGSTQVVSNR